MMGLALLKIFLDCLNYIKIKIIFIEIHQTIKVQADKDQENPSTIIIINNIIIKSLFYIFFFLALIYFDFYKENSKNRIDSIK